VVARHCWPLSLNVALGVRLRLTVGMLVEFGHWAVRCMVRLSVAYVMPHQGPYMAPLMSSPPGEPSLG
jgi:hypothetical protein